MTSAVAEPAQAPGGAAVALPWGAWYQDAVHVLGLPARGQVDVLWPPAQAAWSPTQIREALASPLDCPPLDELARGGRRACVVVDDLARPTRAADVLPFLLAQLARAGMPQDAITVLVATGTHRRLTREQIEWKVGREVVAAYAVECHSSDGPLADTGLSFGSDALRLNRIFVEADVKLGIGSTLPHATAGASGGAKLMLPGLADVTAAARAHKLAQMRPPAGGDPSSSGARQEAEVLARKLGFRFAVSVVVNARRETAGVVAGDIVSAHRQACALAAAAQATPLRADYDLLVLNAYPKDTDLIQSQTALAALATAKRPAVVEGGVLLLTSAASEGLGQHALYAPGGTAYRAPGPRRAVGARELWLYTPALAPSQARHLHWEGYPFFDDAGELARALAARFPGGARIGVLPCAPLQRLLDQRS